MFERKTINGQEFVIDGEAMYPIRKDKKYGEYIQVDNELNPYEKAPFNTLFTGRIKDAVETCKSGKGDCIRAIGLMKNRIEVLYFLDRQVGEELRKRTIEGWKDAEFGYIITYGNRNSMAGFYRIEKSLVFETYEKAKAYMSDVLACIKEIVAKYVLKALEDTDKDRVLSDMLNDIQAHFGDNYYMPMHFALDMVNDDMTVKNNYELDEYGYKIEQWCMDCKT